MVDSSKLMLKHRVLVVDDHPDTAEAACMLLANLGHLCTPVRTGAAAIDEAERFKPDIVILDIGLPDLSGYEVARELRSRYGQAIYLCAFTGWGQGDDRLRSISAGFDQHVMKPANAAALREVIANAEQRRGQPAIPA